MTKESKPVDLRKVFLGIQGSMRVLLESNRETVPHPTAKGDRTELHWLEILRDYLPRRYSVEKAFVVDSKGRLSDQIDIVVYDRQYSPLLLNNKGTIYVPAESVYGVFEVRQTLDAENVAYAADKAASVRALHRTNAVIHHVGGKYTQPPEPKRILAGILTVESEWSPPFGAPFEKALRLTPERQLDLGCALTHGGFETDYEDGDTPSIETSGSDAALIFFFMRLLARLQAMATVPAIDFREYGKALGD